MKKKLETERLLLREFELSDAAFIVTLLNTPTWLRFIGDKNVKTLTDAKKYLETGPLQSYIDHGYGLWAIQHKTDNFRIGMCGLVNRKGLADIDIGFALLPQFAGKGYGFEAASATMQYAKQHLNIPRVIAITDAENKASIRLLHKIGLEFERVWKLSKNNSVLVFAPVDTPEKMEDFR